MNKIMELLIRAMPYPEQMRDFDISEGSVEFTWRGTRYRVTESGVDEVGDGVLIGSDSAILVRALLDYERARSIR